MSQPELFQDTDVSALVGKISQFPRSENDVVLLFIAEHTPLDIQELSDRCKQWGISVAGGVFPGVIYSDRKFENGIVADVLTLAAEPTLITGLHAENFIMPQLPDFSSDQHYTALVLVDGLTKYISAFLDRLFRHMGNQVHYIGGGAGSLSFQQKPCLFDSSGVYQDAALILWLKSSVNLGVRHGWQKLRGPLIATESDGTILHKLSRKPAFAVYSEIIKLKTGLDLTKENFFDIAKEHPLGIFNAEVDYIVRDPIAFTDDGALVCVGEVPPGSMIYVLQGDKKNLIENAEFATQEAGTGGIAVRHNLIVDCISRVLYLEDDFGEELAAVLNALPDDAPTPFGVLSIGEIATFMTGRVEFFNKTIVIGSLRDAP